MATTLSFILLGNATSLERAFGDATRSADQTSRAIDRNNSAMRRHRTESDKTAQHVSTLSGIISGFGDVSTAASKKHNMLARAIAGLSLATGPAEFAISALVGTVGSLAAGLTAAGLGVAAYGAAFLPIMSQTTALMKKQAAAASGGTAAVKAYDKALAASPPAIRAFAKELQGVDKQWKAWSISLAKPVLAPVNAALKLVGPLLKLMTPFVKQASAGFTELVRQMGTGIRSTGFKEWLQAMLPLVQPVIIQLGVAIGHIVTGFGGIVKAFAPFATGVLTGLDNITGRFAAWSRDLSRHSGFQKMLDQWINDWPLMKQALESLVKIVFNIAKGWASMTVGGNSKLMWEIANPLLALASSKYLTGNQGLVALFTYIYLISKAAGPLKKVFDGLKSGWGTIQSVLYMLTGGKFGKSMQTPADTMLLASRNMQKAADTMAGASGLGAAEGGGAAGAGVKTAEGAAGGAAIGRILRTGALRWGVRLGIGWAVTELIVKPVLQSMPTKGGNWWDAPFGTQKGKGPFNSWRDLGHLVLGGFWQGISDKWDEFWKNVSAIPGKIIGIFTKDFGITSPSTVMHRIGWELISGLYKGITDRMAGIFAWVNRWIVHPLVGAVKGLLGIKSPSQVFRDIGWQSISGMFAGIIARMAGIAGWVNRWIVHPLVSAVKGLLGIKSASQVFHDIGWESISGMFAGIIDRMAPIMSWVKKWIVDPLIGAVKRFFGIKSPSTVFYGIGRNLTLGLLGGLASSHPHNFIQKIFGGMPAALGRIVMKGLIPASGLPKKAMDALGKLGGWFQSWWDKLFGGVVGWPFPTKSLSQLRRVDEGQDMQYPGSTPVPIRAIASGRVVTLGPDPGGFGMAYPGEILDRAIQGFREIYYGHVFPQPGISGKHVMAGQTIAHTGGATSGGDAAGLPNWLELGFWPPSWANGPLMHRVLTATHGLLGFGARLGAGPSGAWTLGGLEGLWGRAGGPSWAAHVAGAVALAESGGNPKAHNPSGATGLWQILGQVFPGNLWDPYINARNAVRKFYQAGGFSPWVTYDTGAYRRFMAAGGAIDEPIAGLGLRTGTRYTFGEAGHEQVSSQADLKTVAALLAAVLAELRLLNGHAAVNPGRTGQAVGAALNRAAGAAALVR